MTRRAPAADLKASSLPDRLILLLGIELAQREREPRQEHQIACCLKRLNFCQHILYRSSLTMPHCHVTLGDLLMFAWYRAAGAGVGQS